MKEEGSAHFVKVGIEMGALEGDEEAKLNDRSLRKGRSLPKPSVIRQYSFQRIFKTLSLSPYEIHSNLPCEDVTEKKNHI